MIDLKTMNNAIDDFQNILPNWTPHVKTVNSLFSVCDLIVNTLQHDFHVIIGWHIMSHAIDRTSYIIYIHRCNCVDAVRGKGMLQK